MYILNKLKNLKLEILFFIFFVLVRLPYLGFEMFNTDVWKWKSRIFDFGQGVFTLDFAMTLQRYHPGVTLMWIGSFAVKAHNLYYENLLGINPYLDPIKVVFSIHFFQKLFIIISLAFVYTVILYFVKKMFGNKYALISTVLLSMEPFYYALTRVVHLEGLMTAFIFASIILFYYYYFYENKKWIFLLSSFFGALGFLTKTSATFIPLFIGFILFFEYINRRKKLFQVSKVFLLWFLGFVLWIFALWPALWVIPSDTLATLSRGVFSVGVEDGHAQIFFGKMSPDPGFFFYPSVIAFKSSIYLLPLLIFSVYLYLKGKFAKDIEKFIGYMLFFVFFYFLMITIPSKKLDRYVIPIIISFVYIYSFAIVYYLNMFKGRVLYLITIAVLLPSIITIVLLKNDYFSYYSPYFGGIKYGIKTLEPKWIIGHHQIALFARSRIQSGEYRAWENDVSISDLVNKPNVDKRLTLAFPEKYYTQIWPFIRKEGAWAVIEYLYPEARHAQYFIFPVWEDTAIEKKRYRLVLVDKIYLNGVPVYNVYENLAALGK